MDYLKQMAKVEQELKEKGMTVVRTYRAFEGDLRVIAREEETDWLHRFTICENGELEEM